ncbi:L-rhamnulokinase [Amphibacillus marinus]|uniref:Rhamnulokinase n=1 Tax=Amphibacillus marinus TaxID=872970 RepID=A0A1H8H398_9BACI|nr:rhamnulokinase [Amphibacillus marinus]SEN50716.1 L-rhamnulokinase [Amphibacillus marinus]
MINCHLAVDIGASSGRLMAGFLDQEKLVLKEIYRFNNQMIRQAGYLCWDIDFLFQSIKAGVKAAIEANYRPESLAIDTWAVDFVLLNEDDERVTPAVAYRDRRTDGVMEQVLAEVDRDSLYNRTGIQFQPFNTIYQLKALQAQQPELIEQAKTFLMLPDYLNFLLTGQKVNEYTNATSTQLINLETRDWDFALLNRLDLPLQIFQPIALPKKNLGPIKASLIAEWGISFDVILPATHDTGSAIIAVPEQEDTIYLSSGTWSLMGIETMQPINSAQALARNFTNEGGLDYRYRFLKNIMGLWMIQEVKRLYNDCYSFSSFVDLAKREHNFNSIVAVNDNRFLSPDNMISQIQAACRESKQQVPETPGQIARTIFMSLARSYEQTVQEIEQIADKKYNSIHIIGGGSQNEWLNELLADYTGKAVYAGPIEATAIGNLVVQLLALNKVASLDQARRIIKDSFPINKY